MVVSGERCLMVDGSAWCNVAMWLFLTMSRKCLVLDSNSGWYSVVLWLIVAVAHTVCVVVDSDSGSYSLCCG